jgi:hypothetical protein
VPKRTQYLYFIGGIDIKEENDLKNDIVLSPRMTLLPASTSSASIVGM